MNPALDVPEGYKLTEVGVIPGDWTPTTIGEVVSFSGGSQPPRSTFRFAPTRDYIRLIQIRDYKSDAFETYIPNTLARKLCTADDVMIGRYGPPVFQILRGIDGAYNVALIKTDPTDRIERDYMFYVLKQDKLFQIIDAMSRRSSGQTGVEMPALRGYGLPLPPLPEQRAIAAALLDVDALLAKLDQLIAKKRDLKQAAMQQLLTGQTRLPGFSGEWVERLLGDIAPLQRGFDLPNSQLKRGPYPVVYSNGIGNHHVAFQVKGPGVVTGRSGTIGAVTYVEKDFWPHNTSLWVKAFKDNDAKFVFYLYTRIGLERFATGSGVPTLNRNDVHMFKMRIPASKAEQTAIATLLSDMDAELAALEARRDKTRALKQGMMQALLTGRIRLI